MQVSSSGHSVFSFSHAVPGKSHLKMTAYISFIVMAVAAVAAAVFMTLSFTLAVTLTACVGVIALGTLIFTLYKLAVRKENTQNSAGDVEYHAFHLDFITVKNSDEACHLFKDSSLYQAYKILKVGSETMYGICFRLEGEIVMLENSEIDSIWDKAEELMKPYIRHF